MDNKRHADSPSSSFTYDLFGAKESSNSSESTGIFWSIFPPPSTVVGRNSTSELIGSLQKQFSANQAWGKENSDDMTNREGVRDCKSHTETRSIFQERIQPHPLSSSLYYGGQENMYVQSSSLRMHKQRDYILILRKMRKKMIPVETVLMVLPEEIGGKVHFITRIQAPCCKAC